MKLKIVLFCLVVLAALLVDLHYNLVTYDTTKDTRIVSLRSNNEAGGAFFLGTGYSQGQEYYYFYESLENGGFHLSKVFAGPDVTIYEENRSDGVMRLKEKGYDYEAIKKWLDFRAQTERAVSFHIPVGSIQRNFVLR